MITSLPMECVSAISQWQTFIRVLPTRWRRKPAGIDITSLSPYALLLILLCICTLTGRSVASIGDFKLCNARSCTTFTTLEMYPAAMHNTPLGRNASRVANTEIETDLLLCPRRLRRWPAAAGSWVKMQNPARWTAAAVSWSWWCRVTYGWARSAHRKTRSSAIAEGPRDAPCQLKSCQLPRNSAETICMTSREPSISCR